MISRRPLLGRLFSYTYNYVNLTVDSVLYTCYIITVDREKVFPLRQLLSKLYIDAKVA